MVNGWFRTGDAGMRIVIVLVAGTATGVASFLPPILAAMNWLFAWLVPVFWVLVFGLF